MFEPMSKKVIYNSAEDACQSSNQCSTQSHL